MTGRFPTFQFDEERDGYVADEPSQSSIEDMFQELAPNAHLSTTVNQRTDYLVVGWDPDENLVQEAANNGFTRIIRSDQYVRLLQDNLNALEPRHIDGSEIAVNDDNAEDEPVSVISINSSLHLSVHSQLQGHVENLSEEQPGEGLYGESYLILCGTFPRPTILSLFRDQLSFHFSVTNCPFHNMLSRHRHSLRCSLQRIFIVSVCVSSYSGHTHL